MPDLEIGIAILLLLGLTIYRKTKGLRTSSSDDSSGRFGFGPSIPSFTDKPDEIGVDDEIEEGEEVNDRAEIDDDDRFGIRSSVASVTDKLDGDDGEADEDGDDGDRFGIKSSIASAKEEFEQGKSDVKSGSDS